MNDRVEDQVAIGIDAPPSQVQLQAFQLRQAGQGLGQ